MKWFTALKMHYIASMEVTFKQFRLGAMVFFLGLVIVYSAHQLLPPSLEQEWATLAGLTLVAIGFMVAMTAQIRLIISRIVRFFFNH